MCQIFLLVTAPGESLYTVHFSSQLPFSTDNKKASSRNSYQHGNASPEFGANLRLLNSYIQAFPQRFKVFFSVARGSKSRWGLALADPFFPRFSGSPGACAKHTIHMNMRESSPFSSSSMLMQVRTGKIPVISPKVVLIPFRFGSYRK